MSESNGKRVSFVLAVGLVACAGGHLAQCTYLNPVVERASNETADAIIRYCETFTESQRERYRQMVDNQLPQGYTATVICAEDETP